MKWSALWGLTMIVMVITVELTCIRAVPHSRNEDMFRELLKLDQMYSSIARPSVQTRSLQSDMSPKVQRAINILRLQHLDQLYADKSRPRFGKREHTNNDLIHGEYEPQYSNEDTGDWIPVRR